MSRTSPSPTDSPAIDLCMSSRIEQVPRLVAQFEDFGLSHGLPASLLHDLQVSLDEVLSNIVRYAYADEREHRIGVRVRIDPAHVVAEVTDDGRPFNPLEWPAAGGGPPARDMDRGLGIYILRRLLDDLHYERSGRLNRLVMRKALPARSS